MSRTRANPEPLLRLDRSRHAAPQVFERLREMILSLELEPGAVLSRADLAQCFGISQTPVRDALLRLGEEGLVDIFPQHATLVSRISLASAAQAHFLRRSIELEVVRTLATDAGAPLIAELRIAVDSQQRVLAAGDLQQFLALDQSFHRQMYEAAGVPQLWDMVRRRSGHLDRLRRLHLPVDGKAAAIIRDHRERSMRSSAAIRRLPRRLLRRHLSGTLSQAEQIRRSHPAL